MSKQVDELMALARQWVEARTKDQGDSPQQDALRTALEDALKPGEPEQSVRHVEIPAKNWEEMCVRPPKHVHGLPVDTAPPAQTPPRLTDDAIEELFYVESLRDLSFARAIETAVRAQFGMQE